MSQGAVAAVLGGTAAAVVLRAPIGTLAVAAGAGFWGVTRARAAVDRAIEQRAERIRLELPTVNQLLALHADGKNMWCRSPAATVLSLMAASHW